MNSCSLSPDTGGSLQPDDDGKPGRGFLRQSIIHIPDMIAPYHACYRIDIILMETPQLLCTQPSTFLICKISKKQKASPSA